MEVSGLAVFFEVEAAERSWKYVGTELERSSNGVGGGSLLKGSGSRFERGWQLKLSVVTTLNVRTKIPPAPHTQLHTHTHKHRDTETKYDVTLCKGKHEFVLDRVEDGISWHEVEVPPKVPAQGYRKQHKL
jgi:hypothetical protein